MLQKELQVRNIPAASRI